MNAFQQLLKAFQVFNNYENDGFVATSHEAIAVGGSSPEKMSEADRAVLKECGFRWQEEFQEWHRDM